MIFSENRDPLFGIMLWTRAASASRPDRYGRRSYFPPQAGIHRAGKCS